MRAVVFGADHKPHVQEVPEPDPAADEVVLSVDFCGICGSDLHAAPPDFHVGVTMGHEFSGEVVAVGSDVADWAVGERACVNPNGDWCGACMACRQGRHNMCPAIWDNVVGLARNGGMAPLAAVRARTLHRLPEAVGPLQGAWVEPVAVALRTVRRSGLKVGDTAVVFGAGPIGLLVTKLLRVGGASEIIAIEPERARATAARDMGADEVLDPTTVDVVSRFADPGSAPALAFECTGIAKVVRSALEILRPHGRLMVTGFSREDPSFQAKDLLFKELQVVGSFIYVDEFPAAIDLLAREAIDIEPLTSGVLDFDQGVEAFTRMLTSTSTIKLVLSDTVSAT